MAEKFQYPAGGLVPGTKYRVIRLLGAGGMGTVYEVEDTTIDKRYVLCRHYEDGGILYVCGPDPATAHASLDVAGVASRFGVARQAA